MKYRNKVLTLAAIATVFLVGCSPVGYMKESLEVYKKNQQKAAQQNLQKREGTVAVNIKKGQELHCVLVDEGYDAQAHCRNNSNTIHFYTTYRKILTHYKIVHKQVVSTDNTNMKILPNNRLAHLKIWITKK